MLNIPESVKNLFKTDGVRKNFRAHFPNGELPDITNDDIVQESVKFSESLCSQDVFKFGLAEASTIEFETVGIPNMYGMWIECSCEIDTSSLSAAELDAAGAEGYDGTLVLAADSDLGHGFYRVPYGTFRVESCPRDHQAMAHRLVTAYSKSVDSLAKTLPQLPSKSAFKTIRVDPAALLAQMTGQGLESAVEDFTDYRFEFPYVYDKSGNAYEIRPRLTWRKAGSLSGTVQLSLAMAKTSVAGADFARADIDFDRAAHFSVGEEIARKLTDGGYELFYDNKGNNVYKTNLAALMEINPYLFQPVYAVEWPEHDSSAAARGFAGWTPVQSGALTPIVGLERTAKEKAAFAVDAASATYPYKISLVRLGSRNSAPADATKLQFSFSLFKVKTEEFPFSATLEAAPPDITVRSVEKLTMSSYSPYKLLYEGTEAETFPVVEDTTEESSGNFVSLKRYSYGGLELAEITDGYLELTAQFGKIHRDGNMKLFHLEKASAAVLGPSDYSNFWLDEYSIDSIGAVKYAYTAETGEESERTYRFGAGSSTYDMRDNAVIKMLAGATPDSVEAMLQESFVPHLDAVNFTPIDLSMKGLPYIEDGDYLTVTAQDGTLVESFNLEHTMKGAQVLSADVKSVSGEILESWGT